MLSACSFAGLRNARPTPHNGFRCKADVWVPIIDAAIAVTGITVALVEQHKIDGDSVLSEPDRVLFVRVPATIGVIAGISATYGYFEVDSCRSDERRLLAAQHATEQQARVRAQTRENAWNATKAAALAARNHDCATVARIDADVRMLDAELYAAVFARDVAIARCLAQPGP